jgi:bla regulator protein blaR1
MDQTNPAVGQSSANRSATTANYIDQVHEVQAAPSAPEPPLPPRAPARPPELIEPAAPVAPVAPVNPIETPAVPLAPPVAAPAPPPPVAPLLGQGSSDEDYVIVVGSFSLTRGSFENALRIRSKLKGDYIWFKRDGRAYVIRDATTIGLAKRLFSFNDGDSQRLASLQDELSAQQAALGNLQEELSRQQQQVRVAAPDIASDVDRLAESLKGAKNAKELSDLQQELSRLQAKLSESQFNVSREQSKLSEKQAELGRQQSELSRRQSDLSRQQSSLSAAQARAWGEALKKLRQMLSEAIRSGVAEPEP